MRNFLSINILLLIFAANICAQSDEILNSKITLAKRYEQAGEFEKAKQIYHSVLQEQPWNFELVKSLNEIFLKLKEYDNSIILLEDRLALNPSDPNIYGLLGATYSTMGNNEKAFQVWDKGVETNKSSMVVYRVIADYAIQKRAFEKAIDILKKGQANVNDPAIFSFDLGNLYSVTMEFKEAAEVYCALLLTNPENIGAVQSRMNRYLTHPNSLLPTIETVENFYNKYKSPVFLDLLNYLYSNQRNYSKALDVIIQKEKISGNSGTFILNFARSVFGDGDYETSSKAFQFLIDNYPSASFVPDAKLGLLRSEEEKLNLSHIDSANSWKPFNSPDTTGSYKYFSLINSYEDLANTYFKENIIAFAKLRIAIIKQTIFHNFDEAQKIYSQLFQSRLSVPLIPQILEKLAEISIKKNDLNAAESYYNRMKQIPSTDISKKSLSSFMSAKINFWKGDFPSAVKGLAEISKNLSDDYANDAIELSIIINTLKRDSLNLVNYANADLLSEQNKFAEAAAEFKKLADNKNLLLLNDISKYKYAQMQIALNNYNEALQALEELSSGTIKNVYSDKALYLLGNAYLYALNNNEKASSVFQNLLDAFPNSLYFDKSRQMLNVINKGIKQTI